MKSHWRLLFGLLLFLFGTVNVFGQNDLSVAYAVNGIPDILNLCGKPDTATILITTSGINSNTRTNITANVKLAGGIRIISLLTGESTNGVSLQAGAGTNTPQFTIPDLSPSGLNEAKLTFLVKADCSIIDSLSQNPSYDLKDTWSINYDIQDAANQVVRTLNSYRAAIRTPDLVINPLQVAQKVKTGDCLTRTTKVNNTSLDAYFMNLTYQVQATPSFYYTAIRVNGTNVNITKTVSPLGDTIVSADIDGSLFVANGGTSNNDTLFDSNEEITIEEDFCLTNCNDFATTHKISYGCFGDTCKVFSKEAGLEAGQGNISIIYDTNNTTTPSQNAGYCKTGVSAVKITNAGVAIDPGFADIFDVQVGIGLGYPASLSHGGYTIQSIEVQGITINTPEVLKTLDNNPAFAVDPDGAGGLADLDGDGFFDDLPEGESIEIVARYDFNCGDAANIDLSTNCDTSFTSRLSAYFEYNTTCKEHQKTERTNYFAIYNQQVVVENYNTPDVDAGSGEIFYLDHQHDRRIYNFDKGCANGSFYVQLTLPQGIHLDSAHTSLVQSEVINHPMTSQTMSNDTLTVKFDPGPFEILNGNYDLKLAFTADCNAADGRVHFDGEFGFMCPDCNCKHVWYCADITGTYVHVKNPPCPTAPTCDNAIRTDDMEMRRTTFGFTDSTYTTPIDPAAANAKSGLNCDTMLLSIDGLSGSAFTGNDIGIDVSYANPLYGDGTDNVFNYERGYLEIKHAGVVSTCEIPKNSLTTTPVDPYKYLDFSLLASLQSCGLTVQPDDTVRAYLYFTVNDEGPFPNNFFLVPELRAGFYANNPAKITCGNYGDEVKVGKNRVLISGPNNSVQPQGCDTAFLDYKIIPINNGYPLTNPAEHRPAVAIDSVTFDYEPFLLNGFAGVKVQASIINHPSFGNDYYDIGSLDNSGHFVATFDTLTQFPSMLNIVDYAIAIRFMALPKCESQTGSFNGDNTYDFDANIYYKGNYHAFNIRGGACVKDTTYNNTNDIAYSKPPEISLENLGPPIVNAENNTISWKVRQCNTTNYADAVVSWVSLENISSAVNVISMEDITDPANTIPLTVNNIPLGGYYANTNGLLRAVATNTPDDICNIIQIKVQLTDCGLITADINSGWNCSAFDPTLHPFCAKSTLQVQGTTQPPHLSIIQTSNADPKPFCDTIPVAVTIQNTQLGNDYNMGVLMTLPPNAVLVPGSVEIAWPPSAGFQPLGSDPVYTSSSVLGDNYTFDPFAPYPYLGINGLPKTSTTTVTDSNQIAIRYQLVSDCGFTSGRSVKLILSGEEFCGDAVDTTGFKTFPIFITGGEADPANQIQIVPTVGDTINGQFPVNIQITNVGDSITGPLDKIKVLLSQNITYVPNSATAANWTPGEPTISAQNGITTLSWTLPQGMTQGDINSFSFELNSMDIGCGSADFQLGFMTIRETQQYCAVSNSNCTVEIITAPLQIRDIHKKGSPIITIGSSVSDTLCAGQTINLTANGSDDITWIQMPSGDTIGVGNPIPLIPNMSITGIIATATSDTCSISSDTLNIVVLDAPFLSLPGDTTINEGDTILINGNLTTNIPTSLTWTPTTNLSDTTIANPLAYPTDSTAYILEALGNTGCAVTDTININVIPKIDTVPCPIFSIAGDSTNYLTVCGLDAYFPISIEYDSLWKYKIYLDGDLVDTLITPSTQNRGIYPLTGILAATGPFDITWYFDNKIEIATVQDLDDLLIQFNQWDSFGNWFFDQNNEYLWGGAPFYDYGSLSIKNNSGLDIKASYSEATSVGQSQLLLAAGLHQLIVYDSTQSCADTINIAAACSPFSPNSGTGACISDQIYIDQSLTYCIDTTTLPGTIVSYTNICANSDSSAVEYVLNDSSFCVEYVGQALGNDSACVVICDNYGLCDTINFCTEVIDYDGLPIANDDSTCVYMNTPGVIDFLANDTTWGGIDSLYFVNTPLSGQMVLNLDNTITYTPDHNICERTERLQYIVCNSNGCDDAFLDICILCDDIVVFTAVSPNEDGVNDVFYIANIQNYPNNEVDVYNRWGNRVFHGTGYVNTWNGYWNNNTIVPDGTYYYVIRLNDRAHRVFKGYLEIQR